MTPALREIIGRARVSAIHGGIYSGPARYQDLRYKERCDRLTAERAKKAKPKESAA